MINDELFRRYHIDINDDELSKLHTFLIVTDYIPNKIIETQYFGKSIPDYTEILEARQYARDRINKLKGER